MRLILFIFMVILSGCDKTMDSSTHPEEAIKILTSNFNKNKKIFQQIASFHEDNPKLDGNEYYCGGPRSENFYKSEYYANLSNREKEKIRISETICPKYEEAKMYFRGRIAENQNLLFDTFSNETNLSYNAYYYIYSNNGTLNDLGACNKEYLKSSTKRGECIYKLYNNWYLQHLYVPISIVNSIKRGTGVEETKKL